MSLLTLHVDCLMKCQIRAEGRRNDVDVGGRSRDRHNCWNVKQRRLLLQPSLVLRLYISSRGSVSGFKIDVVFVRQCVVKHRHHINKPVQDYVTVFRSPGNPIPFERGSLAFKNFDRHLRFLLYIHFHLGFSPPCISTVSGWAKQA